MNNTSARKNILEKIARALSISPEFSKPEISDQRFFKNEKGDLLEKFSSEFAAIDGKLQLFEDKWDLQKKLVEIKEQNGWKDIYFSKSSLSFNLGLEDLPFIAGAAPETAMAVITGCEYLIARTGTIVLSAAQEYGRALTVYAPVHIVVASTDQLVEDIRDGIDGLLDRYGEGLPSAFFFASGPSRTGDIEKTLVKGVHGPTQVYLFLFESDDATTGQAHFHSKL